MGTSYTSDEWSNDDWDSGIKFRQQAQLLGQVAPVVFQSGVFALKGGTAINFFLRDLPRLSVDIDCTYINGTKNRNDAIQDIHNALGAIATNLSARGFQTRNMGKLDKLMITEKSTQTTVKIEVNPIARGSVLPVEMRSPSPNALPYFQHGVTLPVLHEAEVYAGKFAAALTRSHPRDLFDVREFLKVNQELTPLQMDTFLVTLLADDRPLKDSLFRQKFRVDRGIFKETTEGMFLTPCEFEDILPIPELLQTKLISAMSPDQKEFLYSFQACEPKWNLLSVENCDQLPAIRWKQINLARLRDLNPTKFNAQLDEIEFHLGVTPKLDIDPFDELAEDTQKTIESRLGKSPVAPTVSVSQNHHDDEPKITQNTPRIPRKK